MRPTPRPWLTFLLTKDPRELLGSTPAFMRDLRIYVVELIVHVGETSIVLSPDAKILNYRQLYTFSRQWSLLQT